MSTSEFQVTILAAGLGGAAPADGFIDPSTVEQYRNNLLAVGTSFGTVAVGQTVVINNVPVTLSSGVLVANVAADINAMSAVHHAVAGVSAGKLTLQNEPLFTAIPVNMTDGTPGIIAQLGFAPPTLTSLAQPTTLVQSLAKKRANLRWGMIMARLGQTMTVDAVHGVVVTGQTLFSVDPTAIQFNVVLDNDQPYAYDINGNLVYGAAAVQQAVALALMDDDIMVVDLYDPSVPGSSPNPPGIVNGLCADKVEVGALTTDMPTALAAVTVTFVA